MVGVGDICVVADGLGEGCWVIFESALHECDQNILPKAKLKNGRNYN